MRPKYPSRVNVLRRENAIHRNAYDDANTNFYPTSPVTKTRGLNEPVFASFEQNNVSRTKTHLTEDGATAFDEKLNYTNNHKISEELHLSEKTPNGKVADSNLTRISEFQYMDLSSPDYTSVIDIPKTRDGMESKYDELKGALEDSSINSTQPLPSSVNSKPNESYVHVVNKLVHTYLPPPKPMVPFYDVYPYVDRNAILRKYSFSQHSPNILGFKERRRVHKEFPGLTIGEVLNQLAWDKMSKSIPSGDEENRTDSIDNHQIPHKRDDHKLVTTHPMRKYTVDSTDIATSNSGLTNSALDNENSFSLNSFGCKNRFNADEIDAHEVREPDGLTSYKKITENSRIDKEKDSITLNSLSSLSTQEQPDGATYSYSTKAEDSYLFLDGTNPVGQETINKPHSLNNIMDTNCIPSDIQSKPPNSLQEQPKPHHIVDRKKNFNQIDQNFHSYAHATGDVHRRGKTSQTSYVNQCHKCKKYSPPHRRHFAHPKNTYEDSQYYDRLSHLQTPSTQRPIQDHTGYSGPNSPWVDEKYHIQNYNHQNVNLMEGSRSSTTETPPWTFYPGSHVQARVPYWNNNFYPLSYSSGDAHPQMVMPGASSPLPRGSPRSAAPTQSPTPPSFNTPHYPENAWMDPSKRDQFIPDRYESSPLKYNPSFSPVEAYHQNQGFAHGIYQNQRQKPHQTKQVFTGRAGYNWPTILKPEPTDRNAEEENMPVYTKPSVRKSFFADDEIKKAMEKYTTRLKKNMYKNKILTGHESNPGKDLDRPTLNSNVGYKKIYTQKDCTR